MANIIPIRASATFATPCRVRLASNPYNDCFRRHLLAAVMLLFVSVLSRQITSAILHTPIENATAYSYALFKYPLGVIDTGGSEYEYEISLEFNSDPRKEPFVLQGQGASAWRF